jgi:hypothetical protein
MAVLAGFFFFFFIPKLTVPICLVCICDFLSTIGITDFAVRDDIDNLAQTLADIVSCTAYKNSNLNSFSIKYTRALIIINIFFKKR